MSTRADPQNLRAIHVVSTTADAESGITTAVFGMCEALRECGIDTDLATLVPPRNARPDFIRTFAPQWPYRLGASSELRRWLKEQASASPVTVIHRHGLWRMAGIYASRAASRSGAKLFTSPHGALSEEGLAQRRFSKKIFWTALEARALHSTACFLASSAIEYEDIRRAGFRQPVCILPHGVAIAPLDHEPKELPYVLFLGRVHPQKGIDILLLAWKDVQPRFPNWNLRIVGPSETAHSRRFRTFAARLGLRNVEFRPPVEGPAKRAAFGGASLFVLPTRSESFGLAVAEALSAAVPVITTDRAPWTGMQARGAGWCVGATARELAAALTVAMATPPAQLAAMGAIGRDWMQRDFRWLSIAQQLVATYRWMVDGRVVPPPEWVRLD